MKLKLVKNLTTVIDKEVVEKIKELKPFERRIALLIFTQGGQVLLTYDEISNLFKLEGYTPEEAMLTEIFGYEFKDIIKYENYDENEFTVFWVKKKPMCGDCDFNCENCENFEDCEGN